MPPIWLTGISHSLNSAASWSSVNWRSSRSRLIFSWSVRPVVSMAARRIRKPARGPGFVIGLHGVVGDLVVVALVAQAGGKLGECGEVVFPVVGEDLVEGFAVGRNT
jgi:hypothetical protein